MLFSNSSCRLGSEGSAVVTSVGSGVIGVSTYLGFVCSVGLGLITGGGVNVTLSVGVVVLPPDSERVGLLTFELNGDVLLSEFTLGRVVTETGDTGSISQPSLWYLTFSLRSLHGVVTGCVVVVGREPRWLRVCGLITMVVTCDLTGESSGRDWSDS